jgi:hypothetical protein
LKNAEWRYDVIPEIVDGMNISDFYDPDIEELLDRLEQEEIEQLDEWENEMQDVRISFLFKTFLVECGFTNELVLLV